MTSREVKVWLLGRVEEELESGEECYAFGLAGRNVISHSIFYDTEEDLQKAYERYVVQEINMNDNVGHCPICGGRGILRRIPDAYSWVECENECVKTFPHESNAGAVAVWNNRARGND